MICLTPQAIQQYIDAHHLPKKEAALSEHAQAVYRYGAFVASELICCKKLPRAMTFAKEQITQSLECGKGFSNGVVVVAEELEQSKGRFSRDWHAPVGGLWGCFVHVNTLLEQSRNLMSLAVGVACCQAVQEFTGEGATIRWVNDVLIKGRKLAGFLVESFTDPVFGERYDIIGFGININNSKFPEELAGLATSLAAVAGREVSLYDFALSFFSHLRWNFGLLYFEEDQLLKHGKYTGKDGEHLVVSSWKQLSDTVGKRVCYGFDVMISPQYEATVVAILPDGSLLMQFDDGTTTVENGGEIRYLS